MQFKEIKILDEGQKSEIINLWNIEYPKKLMLRKLSDFEDYLETLDDKHHIVLMDENEKIKGWLTYFIRDNERCFAMLLDSSVQGQGLGSRFLDLAKQENTELNGWIITCETELKPNGENYKSPLGFYLKNGFKMFPELRLEKKGISGIKVQWMK